MTLQERFNTLRPQVALAIGERCAQCGRAWHPPALCWACDWLDEETIEIIAARIFNESFDELDRQRAVLAWEGEGGR